MTRHHNINGNIVPFTAAEEAEWDAKEAAYAAKKAKEKMHKPFGNFLEVLDDIKRFNSNLYLCCLLTYGCLLRPHREIRELTWGDFSEDLSHINLSGNRNKSGRNRLVPVPTFIKELQIDNQPFYEFVIINKSI